MLATADLKEKYPEYFQHEKIPEMLQQKLVDLPVMKKCSKCGESKPATKEYFHNHSGGKYGVSSKCVECHKRKNSPQLYYKNKRIGKDILEKFSEFFKVCIGCDKTLLATNKYFHSMSKRRQSRLISRCIKCNSKQVRENYYKNHEKKLTVKRNYAESNKEHIKQLNKKYHAEKRYEPYHKKYREDHREQLCLATRKYNKVCRERVIRHYSEGKMCCNCCGYSELGFLTIDHIDGNPIRSAEGNGSGFVLWLIRNDLPAGFQILCFCCNSAKGVKKHCPHIQSHKQKYASKDSERISKKQQEYRKIVIDHYTKGKRTCQCCGYQGLPFLSIDHINGDGKIHRKKITSSSLPHWIVKNNFPPDFQILCHNCNLAKGTSNICPHKQKKI